MNIAVDSERKEAYKLYASPEMYHVVRFYMTDQDVIELKNTDDTAVNALLDEIEGKDVVIFAKNGEISPELMKKARTLDAKKFRLHLFTEN